MILGLVGASRAPAASHSHSEPVQIDPTVPAPSIAFDQFAFDFGTIQAGQPVTHAFIVTNSGNAVLRIENTIPSCSCTLASVGQRELKPGESTTLQAVYTPEKNFVGAMRRSILVISNDPRHQRLTLRLAGEVKTSARPDPVSAP